jgi:two-component system chemotaxis response regulator CheB
MIIKPGGPNAQDALYRAMSPVIAELARARRGRALRAERHATPAPWLDPAAANEPRSLAPRSNSRGAPFTPPQESESERPPSATRREVIAIGASTGGPPVIVSLLRALPPAFATPIVVTQHMPASHVSYFVDLLIARAGRMVRVPEDGELLERATVYVAGPRGHLVVSRRDGRLRLWHDDGPPEHQCKPAVDPMFRSVAEACGPAALAVVMSGMGADGAMGALAMRQRGAAVIVQDEASSAVWGMPGAAVAAGAADHIAAASELAPWVLRLTQAENPIDAQGRR